MRQHLNLTQVLLLTNDRHVEHTAAALWSMLREVERLFNVAPETLTARRCFIAPRLTPSIADHTAGGEYIQMSETDITELVTASAGPYEQTVDGLELERQIRPRLEDRGLHGEALLLVTDLELTPPSEYRYSLWRSASGSGIVSIAPMDPDYWGIEDQDWVRTIKRRARAASICVVGEELGLQRCDNASCYMFGKVDSVLRLDVMTAIGTEHQDFPPEGSIGYRRETFDPVSIEPVAQADELYLKGWPSL